MPNDEVLESYYNGTYWDVERAKVVADADYLLDADERRAVRGYKNDIVRVASHWLSGASGIRVHEVGCGFGGLVHQLTKAGFDATGTDFNQAAIAEGRKRGNDRIFAETLERFLSRGGQKPQIFVAMHCLEHMADPGKMLRQMRDALAPEGIAILRVPSGAYLPAHQLSIRRYQWHGYPWHLNLFTPRSMEIALRAAGLRLLEPSCHPFDAQEELLELVREKVGSRPEASHAEIALELARQLRGRELQVIAGRDDGPHAEWVGSELPGPSTRPHGVPVDRIVAHSGAGFGLEQGLHGWSYGSGSSPATVDHWMRVQAERYPAWKCEAPYCTIGHEVAHPGASASALRVWESSTEGVLRLRGDVRVADPKSTGVRWSVSVDGRPVRGEWNAIVTHPNPRTIDTTIEVRRGSRVVFAVSPHLSANYCITRTVVWFERP